MSPLRAFITKREREIREQIRDLRSELHELKTVKQNLPESQSTIADDEARPEPGRTIKDMVRSSLTKRPNGLTATALLKAIAEDFDATIERTSLSPQLSRLRRAGDVVLKDGIWFPSQATLAGWASGSLDDLLG